MASEPPAKASLKDVIERLKEVAYEFADACVAKAMRRLEEHPERSATPWREFPEEFHKMRLQEEFKEWMLDSDNPSEVEDIGNFAAWLWWGLNRSQPFKESA